MNTIYLLHRDGNTLSEWAHRKDALIEPALRNYWGELTDPPETLMGTIAGNTLIVHDAGEIVAVYQIHTYGIIE